MRPNLVHTHNLEGLADRQISHIRDRMKTYLLGRGYKNKPRWMDSVCNFVVREISNGNEYDLKKEEGCRAALEAYNEHCGNGSQQSSVSLYIPEPPSL